MTTRDFSATGLPHPRYSLDVGRFTIKKPTKDSAAAPAQRPINSQQQQQQPQLEEQRLDNAKRQRHEDSTTRRKKSKRDSSGGGGDGTGDDDCGDVNLPSTCLPRFSQLAQVIEVKLPGFTLPNRVGSNIKDFLGSYCVIENARPELFIRRDFISKFVDKGTIHVAQLSDQHTEETPPPSTTTMIHRAAATTAAAAGSTTTTGSAAAAAATTITRAPKCGYKLSTSRDNKLIITMNSKQYHRFGMLATKEILPLQQQQPPGRGKGKKSKRLRNTLDKCYRIEINLRDERIMKCNKYQDKLMQTLGRLNSINKIYFRFIPDKFKLDLSLFAAQEYSQEFFNCIIDEYKLDGCQPVPLTKCSIALQKVGRNWINRAQLHPSLELSKLLAVNKGDTVLFESQPDQGADNQKLEVILNGLVDIIDWHGYQLLSLDCDFLAKLDHCWLDNTDDVATSRQTKGPSKRYDVSCTRIIGAIDYQHVQSSLHKLFTYDKKDDVVFRAMFLYDAKDDKQLLQCNPGAALDESNSADVGGGGDAGEQTSSVNHLDKSRTGMAAATSGGMSCGTNSGVVYLQDCSNGPEAAREITVIGLSELAAG